MHPHANASEWACKLFLVGMQFTARAGIPCMQQGACGWQRDRRECMTCTRHNSPAYICAESLSGSMLSSYSHVTVNNWEQDLTFQAAQGYDEKELEVIHMDQTVRPSHTFCYQLSNTKLLSASKSCSWGNLTTAARNVLSTSSFPPVWRVRVGTEEWEAESKTLKGFALIMKPCAREVAWSPAS